MLELCTKGTKVIHEMLLAPCKVPVVTNSVATIMMSFNVLSVAFLIVIQFS